TFLGGLAKSIDGAVAVQAATALYTSISTDTSFISNFNPYSAIGGAIGSYLGQQFVSAVFEGNPQGQAIGGAIGGAVGTAAGTDVGGTYGASIGTAIFPGLGTLIGAATGAFIGTVFGGALGGLFGGDPAPPEAVSFVELGFRLDAQGFFVVDGYAKDGGSQDVANNIAQAGANALNAFLFVIGGRALDFNELIRFGYVGSQYIGSGGKRYWSVEALLD